MISPEKRRFLVQHLGEERVRELEEELPAFSKALEARGIRFKADKDQAPPHPASAYAHDFLYDRPEELVATAKAIKELRGKGGAAEYVADLLERGPQIVEGSE